MPSNRILTHSSQASVDERLFSFFHHEENFAVREALTVHHWTARLSAAEGLTYAVLTAVNDFGHHIVISVGVRLLPMPRTERIERTALPSRVKDILLELVAVAHFVASTGEEE